MGLINSLSNAFSAAGYGAADFFGKAGLEQMKQQLEQDKIRLADQLAGARQQERFTHEKEMLPLKTREELAAEQGRVDIATNPENVRKRGEAASGMINATLPAEVARKTALMAVDTQAKVDEFSRLDPLRRQAAIETAVAQVKAMATPEMLKATRAIAAAKHIVDPSYTAVPESDGTVTLVDTKSGKTKKMLGEDGEPIVRKDPEELKAAATVINMANTNLKIAQAAYKAVESDVMADPAAKATAKAEWDAAQAEAKRISAPAIAVLYGKAGIQDSGVAPTPKAPYPDGTELKGKDGKIYVVQGGQPVLKSEATKPAKTTATPKPAAVKPTIPGMGPVPGGIIDRIRNRGLGIPLEDDESELNPN